MITRPSKKSLLVGLALLASTSFAGIASAETDNRDVVRNSFGNIVVNSFGNCVRTQWTGKGDECNPTQRPAPRAERARPAEIAKEERTVYFDFNKAMLTTDAKRRLDTLASTLRSDERVKEAKIVGFADRIGKASYNEKLSEKRAENVRNYLTARGFVNARVAETRWFGESVPATTCAENLSRPQLIQCLQADRRVEVEIEYFPEAQARTNY